jgi:uncharacterized protein YbcV (DUF1398 family)
MFTLEQIDGIHERLGRQETLAEYLTALRSIGVDRCESFLADGHSVYIGREGALVSPPIHEVVEVAEHADGAALAEHLRRHAGRETGYLDMVRGVAASGVERWVFDTAALTITYLDRTGGVLLQESVR